MAKGDSLCNLLTQYLLGELSDSQVRDYEQHLRECSQCQSEYESLWPFHKMLLTDSSTADANRRLFEQKGLMLAHAFSKRKPKSRRGLRVDAQKWGNSRRIGRKWVWFLSSTAAVGCLVVTAIIIRNVPADRVQAVPVHALGQWRLVAAETYPTAAGVVLEVHHQDVNNLIVYVNHVPVQTQWGCYGVWGLTGGQWHSLGEFTVDHKGNGAITVHLAGTNHYDKLEITLEPKWGDTKPLGPEVLQSPAVQV